MSIGRPVSQVPLPDTLVLWAPREMLRFLIVVSISLFARWYQGCTILRIELWYEHWVGQTLLDRMILLFRHTISRWYNARVWHMYSFCHIIIICTASSILPRIMSASLTSHSYPWVLSSTRSVHYCANGFTPMMWYTIDWFGSSENFMDDNYTSQQRRYMCDF